MRILDIIRDYLLEQDYTEIYLNHAPTGDNIMIRNVWERSRTKDGAENALHEIIEIQIHRGSASELNTVKNGIIDDLLGLHVLDEVAKCSLDRQETFKKKANGWVWLGWFEIWGYLEPV